MRPHRTTRATILAALAPAHDAGEETETRDAVGEPPSEEGMVAVREGIGCEAASIEEECCDALPEPDDAAREIGRHDTELDGEFGIISMAAG